MQVTTLLSKAKEAGDAPQVSAEHLQALREAVSSQGAAVKDAKAAAAADKENSELQAQVLPLHGPLLNALLQSRL